MASKPVKRSLPGDDKPTSDGSIKSENGALMPAAKRAKVWAAMPNYLSDMTRGPIRSANDLDAYELSELYRISDKVDSMDGDTGQLKARKMENFVAGVFCNWTTDAETQCPPPVNDVPLNKDFSVIGNSECIAKYGVIGQGTFSQSHPKGHLSF